MDALNPEQTLAARHGDGPILVIAGAGTGKTRTLAARVEHLLERGVPPERILLLTFSRQAAREMLSRVRARTETATRIWGGTFHALAHRLLRIYAEPMGLAPSFTVVDRTDAEDLIDLAREDLGLSSEASAQKAPAKRFPKKATCLAIYSRCVNAEETVEKVVTERFPWVAEHAPRLKELFKLYEKRKIARSVLDLDDLLVWWLGLVEDERLGPSVEDRFDHVLVDEYQDTNRLQRRILLALRKRNKNLTVVGDDCQAIYGFRAATVRNILDFERDFPGAALVRLEANYRSTAPILAASNAVIALALERHEKTLRPSTSDAAGGSRPRLVRCRDEAAQADHVIRSALALLEQGILLRRQAVLFRTAHHSDLLEVELGRRRIPFRKFGGLRFLDAAHVKDLLAFLRILENPADETAWFRILKLLDGVGPRTAHGVLEHLGRGRFQLEALATCEVPKSARVSWNGLRELVASVRDLELSATIERVRAFYDPIFQERYDHSATRSQDLEALARLAEGSPSRREFLADVTLDPPASTGDLAGPPVLDEDWLVLSTIHSAKGLEWDAVTLLNAVDGCIPSDLATGDVEDIEEERRLLYVALTRARKHLTVMAPLRFHVRDGVRGRPPTDRHTYAPLTRFLPPSVLQAGFEEVADADGSPGADSPLVGVVPRAADALREKVLKRWD
jgi:DNA helicase-2/ATP-dependent DNA helicase PcrA